MHTIRLLTEKAITENKFNNIEIICKIKNDKTIVKQKDTNDKKLRDIMINIPKINKIKVRPGKLAKNNKQPSMIYERKNISYGQKKTSVNKNKKNK